MIIAVIVVSLMSVGIAVWSLRQTARLNRELDEMEAASAQMIHEIAQREHEMTRRELEEVGQ